MRHQQPAVRTEGLSKRYGRRRQALTECTLSIPSGRVVGLVGPNGAGKTTLLAHRGRTAASRPGGSMCSAAGPPPVRPSWPRWASSLRTHPPMRACRLPTTCGSVPTPAPAGIGSSPRTGYPSSASTPPRRPGLSGGQRAQLALTLAIAKRPELLILDEPVSSLDPLARREFLQNLMAYVAEHGGSVILSSNLVSDLERVCDYLIVLAASRVRVAGEVEDLLASHYRLTGTRRDPLTCRPAPR